MGQKGGRNKHVPGSGETPLHPGLLCCHTGDGTEASAHISVSARPPGRTKPKYSHSPGGRIQAGGRRGGCLYHRSPAPGEGRRGAATAQTLLTQDMQLAQGGEAAPNRLTASLQAKGERG